MIKDIILPASFRGVPFYFKSHSVEGGRKTVVQEFPDSDRRYVQDLGLNNKSFSITGFTNDADIFYLIKRDALILALETPTSGILIHPFFGTLIVYPLNYSLSEDNREQGIATFQMNFVISQLNTTPSVTSNVLGLVTEYALATISFISSNLSSNYKVSNTYPNNYYDAEAKIIDIGVLFGANVAQLNSDPANINTFNSMLTDYNENAINYTSNPSGLSTAIQNLFAQSNLLPQSEDEAITFFELFFNFGNEDSYLPLITAQQLERQKNRDLLNAMIQICSLCYAYINASLITYTTTNDVETIRSILETQYQQVINISNIDTSVFDSLSSLRSTMIKFFQNAEVSAFKITTIQTSQMPIQVFTYQYYGSLDQNQNLIDLNNINDTSFIPTTMEVLIR